MIDPAERIKILESDDSELWNECEFDFIKGTGNGGQKINKTSSTVRLFHAGTGISTASSESRSQSINRHTALKKLRFLVACRFRCEVKPSSEFHAEPAPSIKGHGYIPWIAELFDRLAEYNWDLKAAAAPLHTSRSKLTKLLQRDPALWREFTYASRNPRRDEPEF